MICSYIFVLYIKLLGGNSSKSALLTWSITSDHLPLSFCLNSRIEGYQKVDVPSRPQRQSGTLCSRSHVALPIPPAR